MAENYWGNNAIEVRFAERGHAMWIPVGHSANHERCYGSNPELAKEPIAAKCPVCFPYYGNPTFRTNSANRGSERSGSNKKLVFKPSIDKSRS